MELFRVSFSILDPLSRGDIDEAVRRYFRQEIQPTQAMIEGSAFHDEWRTETVNTGKLPKIFGGGDLIKPECEQKLECVIDSWCQFVGVVDLLTPDTIHEYKTGHSNASNYSRSMQTPCYQLLVMEHGYRPNKAIIHHFNQHNGGVSEAKIWLSAKTEERARDWILTYASELHEAIIMTGGNNASN